jgi:hypothetical protein
MTLDRRAREARPERAISAWGERCPSAPCFMPSEPRRHTMATIVEYTFEKRPMNEYPARIVSPPRSGSCCFSDMEEIGEPLVDVRRPGDHGAGLAPDPPHPGHSRDRWDLPYCPSPLVQRALRHHHRTAHPMANDRDRAYLARPRVHVRSHRPSGGDGGSVEVRKGIPGVRPTGSAVSPTVPDRSVPYARRRIWPWLGGAPANGAARMSWYGRKRECVI